MPARRQAASLLVPLTLPKPEAVVQLQQWSTALAVGAAREGGGQAADEGAGARGNDAAINGAAALALDTVLHGGAGGGVGAGGGNERVRRNRLECATGVREGALGTAKACRPKALRPLSLGQHPHPCV